jgi:hypothetical protein
MWNGFTPSPQSSRTSPKSYSKQAVLELTGRDESVEKPQKFTTQSRSFLKNERQNYKLTKNNEKAMILPNFR